MATIFKSCFPEATATDATVKQFTAGLPSGVPATQPVSVAQVQRFCDYHRTYNELGREVVDSSGRRASEAAGTILNHGQQTIVRCWRARCWRYVLLLCVAL